MSTFWSPLVHELQPYTPGEQPRIDNLVKLNTNENPYPPSSNVLAVLRHEAAETLRLYPDPTALHLRETLAQYHHVKPENVFVGNGSDEVLGHVFQGLLKQSRPLLFPDITYSFYPTYCRLYGIEHRTVPLNAKFEIQLDDYDASGGAFIIANPNAPTGHLLSLAAIEGLLLRHPDRLLVIDEAYIDFGGQSAIPLTRNHPNLLVVHTLSKSRSLAGLRVGFAIGHHDLIDALDRVKNSFNSYPLDRFALAGAVAAYEDQNWFLQTRERIMNTRRHLVQELKQRGFEVLPSHANFVFTRHPAHAALGLAAGLREQAVLVRHFNLPRIENFLRITIGTEAQTERLLKALDTLLK